MLAEKTALIIQTLGNGGAERNVSDLTLALSALGKETHLILYGEEVEYDYAATLHSLGAPLVTGCGRVKKTLDFLKRLFELKKIKRANGYQCSLSYKEGPNLLNVLSRCRDRTVVTIVTYASRFHAEWLPLHAFILYWMTRFFCWRAGHVVVNSKGGKWDLVKNFHVRPEKISTIYNMLDIESIRARAAEDLDARYRRLMKNAKVIITAGRLAQEKGHKCLIRVFAGIKRKCPQAKLVLLGRGELLADLVDMARDLSMTPIVETPESPNLPEGDVYFLGFQKNPYRFFSKASIFVFSSLFEGFPCALVEALSCGVPVVSADCRFGPRELLAPNTDFLCETKQPELAEYGVLMPVLNEKNCDTDRVLSAREIMWVDFLADALEDDDLKKKYSEPGKRRAYDFHIDKIMPQWLECLS